MLIHLHMDSRQQVRGLIHQIPNIRHNSHLILISTRIRVRRLRQRTLQVSMHHHLNSIHHHPNSIRHLANLVLGHVAQGACSC
jgi:hypothetical protein